MTLNGLISITAEKESLDYLSKKIDWILDMMDKEHHNCTTHSQRNMYMAVIRHELEIIQDEIRYARLPGQNERAGDIPF